MIEPQHAVNIVLKEAARSGRADETMVLVTEKVEATLRWAGNSMTTNGVSHSRNVTVISIVRRGDSAFVGSVVSAEVDPSVLPGLVVSSQDAAAPRRRPVMPRRCLPIPESPTTGMPRFRAPGQGFSPVSPAH